MFKKILSVATFIVGCFGVTALLEKNRNKK